MAEENTERIGIRQFGGTGYAEWSYRMEVMLDEKGLLEHVKGEQPVEPNDEWKRNDKKAKGLVYPRRSSGHDSRLYHGLRCLGYFEEHFQSVECS